MAALTLGIIGLATFFVLVPSLLAVTFGLVAARRIKRRGGSERGAGFARAGWIMGVIGLGAGVLFIAAAVNGSFDDGEIAVFELDPGDCTNFDFNTDSDRIVEVTTLDVVDCDEAHEGEVMFLDKLNPGGGRPYPSNDDLFEAIDGECRSRAPSEVAPGVDLSGYSSFTVAPDEESWNEDDGPYVCLAVHEGGQTTIGSLITGT